jgi:RHS repeat-associated protein
MHTDLLGSPVAGTNGSSYSEYYTPWGDKWNHPIQLAGDVGFTGHQNDLATGLTYMQARYYDPVVGRFMAVDPLGFSAANPMSFNRYSYANNNPYKYTDPLGQESACVTVNGCTTFAVSPSPQALSTLADFTPVVGDIKGIVEAIQDPSAVNVIAAGVGLVPGVGDVASRALKTGANILEGAARGVRPPSMSPVGAGRQGALNEAKRVSGVPTSQQPSRTLPNTDARGNRQPGRIYEYESAAPGGGTSTVRIRDDAAGHSYRDDPTQNRGPHFNDDAGRHYDYPR